MTPIQQLMLGVGGAKKIYLDEVFSSNLYNGTGSDLTINNGIDVSGENALVWIKGRNYAGINHVLTDTVRGRTKLLHSDGDWGNITQADTIKSFNSNGFTVGTTGYTNSSSYNYASWTFRKAEGFFDIVSWTGNGTNGRQISHSLSSVPGCIMVKCTSEAQSWSVYHRGLNSGITPEQYHLVLNNSNDEDTTSDWNDTAATSTNFTVGDGTRVNANNKTYVAYLFAGGESTAATARSLDFTPNAHLTVGDHADYRPGTGDFTLEAWIKPDAWGSGAGFWHTINGLTISKTSGGNLGICTNATSTLTASHDPKIGQWTHVAVCRSGSTIRMFYNGTKVAQGSNSVNYGGTGTLTSGHTNYFDGKISNLRMVKGTALYTASFKPPYEPLTNVTNTKLLICNNSDPTAGTVLPTTINNSSAVASTDSPFDDPAAFVFGDTGKENIVKTGNYIGNANNNGPDVYLGFEPQYLLIKDTETSDDWFIYDSMRGVFATDNADEFLAANSTAARNSLTMVNFHSTGFKVTTNDSNINGNNKSMIYIAIRRPDGWVSKPADAATDVFNVVVGNSSSNIPNYVSGFPVDMAIKKNYLNNGSWFIQSRLTGEKYLHTNNDDTQVNITTTVWDSNTGWGKNGDNATYFSTMWKRGAGFDVVNYEGEGASSAPRSLRHSLAKEPEMIWTKNRDQERSWAVWHKDLNTGGSNAANYYLLLDENHNQTANGDLYGGANNVLPTDTHWTTGGNSVVNESGESFTSYLFTSVTGISKCGTYTGSSSSFTVDLGFQPRFIIIKGLASSRNWIVFDTTVDWAKTEMGGAETTKYMSLNDNGGQNTPAVVSGSNIVCYPVSNGVYFTGLQGSMYGHVNNAGTKYIYYAHK